jgi:hypothetical protein
MTARLRALRARLATLAVDLVVNAITSFSESGLGVYERPLSE